MTSKEKCQGSVREPMPIIQSSTIADGPLTRAIAEQSRIPGSECDLCEDPLYPIVDGPTNVLQYRAFFSNIAQVCFILRWI